jgi:hypothetical protein
MALIATGSALVLSCTALVPSRMALDMARAPAAIRELGPLDPGAVSAGLGLSCLPVFGLFAPQNVTVTAVLAAVCSLPVAGAIFMTLELGLSFEGLLQASSVTPVRLGR